MRHIFTSAPATTTAAGTRQCRVFSSRGGCGSVIIVIHKRMRDSWPWPRSHLSPSLMRSIPAVSSISTGIITHNGRPILSPLHPADHADPCPTSQKQTIDLQPTTSVSTNFYHLSSWCLYFIALSIERPHIWQRSERIKKVVQQEKSTMAWSKAKKRPNVRPNQRNDRQVENEM